MRRSNQGHFSGPTTVYAVDTGPPKEKKEEI